MVIIYSVSYVESVALPCPNIEIWIESMKTTSMETVSRGVLDKKEHYLKSKDNAENSHDVLQHIQLHLSKYENKWRSTSHYVILTDQLLFKSRFSKSGQTYRRQVVNPRHQTPQGQSLAKPMDDSSTLLVFKRIRFEAQFTPSICVSENEISCSTKRLTGQLSGVFSVILLANCFRLSRLSTSRSLIR